MSIKKYASYNLLGSVIPMICSFATIPIYLNVIGEARFGVLTIIWLMLGYFGLFEFGLGRATAQRIASLNTGTAAQRAELFWTALTLNVCLGIFGGLIFWLLSNYFFNNIFQLEDMMHLEVRTALPWLIVALPMATLAGVFSGALQGRQRFLELNVISVIGSLMLQLSPLVVAVVHDVKLGALIPAALFARVLTLGMLLRSCQRHIISNNKYSYSRDMAGNLLRFGGWVALTAIISPIMVILDRLLIGTLLGARAVSHYTIPFQLAERCGIIPSALSNALFPRFVETSSEERSRLAARGAAMIALIMTPIAAGGMLIMHPFLAWWISPEFAMNASLVGQILLLGFWINTFARIPFVQLQACGRADLVAKCHVGELIPYISILYLGYLGFGLVGMAIAFSFRVALDFLLLAGLSGILPTLIRLLIIPSLVMFLTSIISMQFEVGSPAWYATACLDLITIALLIVFFKLSQASMNSFF